MTEISNETPTTPLTAEAAVELSRRELAGRLARAAVIPAVVGVMAASTKPAHATPSPPPPDD